jgi:hypothetical protein
MWALFTILNKEGHNVTVLNRHWDGASTRVDKEIMRWTYYHIFYRHFVYFMKNHLKFSPLFSNSDALRKYVTSEGYDAIVVGSDQVWRIENTRKNKLNYFLDFIKDEKIRKIAFSVSFGVDKWNGTGQETAEVTRLLSLFDQISVREKSGVDLCNQVFHQKVEWSLDPTLLLSKESYKEFITKRPIKKSYVATYFLDSTSWKREFSMYLSRYYNANLYHLYPTKRRSYSFYKSVEQWLSGIYYADFVVVDSFHGMVFSIIFKKQFVVIANESRGLTRFTSILSSLGLSDRLYFENLGEYPTLPIRQIDYEKVDDFLSVLRQKSQDLLFAAIK